MTDWSNEFDVILRNGRIVDGTGNPWYYGDVGIRGERIEAVDNLEKAQAPRVIDATNKVVCPGFIDVHVHSEFGILTGEETEARIRQGITSDLLAPDGLSYSPLSDQRLAEMKQYLAIFYGVPDVGWDWNTQEEYQDKYDRKVAMNVVPQVAFNSVRAEVVGWDPRPATPDELERMKEITREVMEAGATGIQTGLEYYPSAHATTEELIEVSKVVAEYGGVYSSHIRGYGENFKTSSEEVFTIAEQAGIPVHFSHLTGRPEFYEPLEAARKRGLDITFESYPYMAGCTHLVYCFPSWAQSGTPDEIIARLKTKEARDRLRPEIDHFFLDRDFSLNDIVFASLATDSNRHLAGMKFGKALEESGKDLTDLTCDLLVEENLRVLMVFHWDDELRLRTALTHPYQMVGSDGVFQKGFPHPRGYGTYPKILGHYVRERGWLTLEDAIRRMSSYPASRYLLRDRGIIRLGMAADVVVFDPETIIDRATYENGTQYSEGVEYVFVNGELVLDDSKMTSALPGRVLKAR